MFMHSFTSKPFLLSNDLQPTAFLARRALECHGAGPVPFSTEVSVTPQLTARTLPPARQHYPQTPWYPGFNPRGIQKPFSLLETLSFSWQKGTGSLCLELILVRSRGNAPGTSNLGSGRGKWCIAFGSSSCFSKSMSMCSNNTEQRHRQRVAVSTTHLIDLCC